MNSNNDMQAKMLKSIEEKTGLKSEIIIQDIKSQELEKHNAIIKYVKEKYALSHGFANLLAHLSKDISTSSDDLVANQYEGKHQLLAIYKVIIEFLNQFKDVEIVPKKAYVSIKSRKQFAIIQPSTKNRLDIGLNFPLDVLLPLEPSGSFNSMVSHKIRIEFPEDFNDLVKEYLKKAYELSL